MAKDEIAVVDLVETALEKQRGRMADHPVKVSVPDSGLSVRGDREMLSMALVQYLDNAVKYSDEGTTVQVTAWESHSEVIISVHNQGPVIPISDRERIFERFYRSEDTKNLAAGTGIGLSTVKMAAETHGATSWVISNMQEGTTFFLSIPQNGEEKQ